jgi:hypothetical protein
MWSKSLGITYTIPEFRSLLVSDDAIASALTSLVRVCAFPCPEGPGHADIPSLRVEHFLGLNEFTELEEAGFVISVSRSDAEGYSKYRATAAALQRLQLQVARFSLVDGDGITASNNSMLFFLCVPEGQSTRLCGRPVLPSSDHRTMLPVSRFQFLFVLWQGTMEAFFVGASRFDTSVSDQRVST